MGIKLHQTFQAAGLPMPLLRVDTSVETGPDSLAFSVLTETVRSVLPVMERFGLATADEIAIVSLEHRLREEAVARRGEMMLPSLFGDWTRH